MRIHPTRLWLALGALLLIATPATALAAAKPPAPGYIGGKSVLVKVERVNGTILHVLTTHRGMTLYYDAQGTKSKPACTGPCTKTWKPYLVVGNGRPTGRPEIDLQLGHVERKGYLYQVEYKGHPLYTYRKATGPGQTRGAGKTPFHIASVSTPPASGSGGGSSA